MKRLQRYCSSQRSPVPHPSRAELRLQKDLEELCYSRFSAGNTGVRIAFPNGRESHRKLSFTCTISPQEGLYRDGNFVFVFNVPTSYPFSAPVVTCKSRVLHPNICWLSGRVGLALLSTDWKPVLSINTVIFGLQLLFLEPDLDHVVDSTIALAMLSNPPHYADMVRQTMRGGVFFGETWEPTMSSNNVRDDTTLKLKRDRDSTDEKGQQQPTLMKTSEPTMKRVRKFVAGRSKRRRDGGVLTYDQGKAPTPERPELQSSRATAANEVKHTATGVAEAICSISIASAAPSAQQQLQQPLDMYSMEEFKESEQDRLTYGGSGYRRIFGKPSHFQMQLLASSFGTKHKAVWGAQLPLPTAVTAVATESTSLNDDDDDDNNMDVQDVHEETKTVSQAVSSSGASSVKVFSSHSPTHGRDPLRGETKTPLPLDGQALSQSPLKSPGGVSGFGVQVHNVSITAAGVDIEDEDADASTSNDSPFEKDYPSLQQGPLKRRARGDVTKTMSASPIRHAQQSSLPQFNFSVGMSPMGNAATWLM